MIMSTAQPQPEVGQSLTVSRTIAAPRERVFEAWTDAKQFALWFHPTPDMKTVITRMDPHVGGKYVIEVHNKNGDVHRLSGAYEQIQPPEKLVFTWRSQFFGDNPDSLVTVLFKDLGGSTEVTIQHQRLFSVEVRDQHNSGWIGCLEQLAAYVN
jgi:uncharacterized protein YndB with AHSA1/START domain